MFQVIRNSLLCVSVLFVSAVYAADTSQDAARLLKYFQGIHSISASFKQTLYADDADDPTVSYGTLKLKDGNKFRLEYTKPFQQIYVADGHELAFYDIDLEQVTIKPQDKDLSNTPAMILSNPAIFIKNYSVKQDKTAHLETYVLTALKETSPYQEIRLVFRDGKLYIMSILDNFTQITELKFSSIAYNKKIPASVFEFRAPDGVDIIRQTLPDNDE